jgi:hypothetical protein
MNLEQLNQKLLAAARRNAPDDRVPLVFEKRIMARLASTPVPDGLALWAVGLWRAAIPCVAVMLLLGVGSLFVAPDNPTGGTAISNPQPATELSQDFENTLLADVNQHDGSIEDAR